MASSKGISSRLANMGFMKKAAAAAQAATATIKQEPDSTPLEAQQQQQQQQQEWTAHLPAARQQQQQQAPQDGSSRQQQRQQQQQQVVVKQEEQQEEHQQQRQEREKSKFKLSENITNMKFMQLGRLKRSREEAFEQEAAAKDAAEWVSSTAIKAKGCTIVMERDPLPAGATGRISFGFGHMHDLQQAEEAEKQAAAEAAAAAEEAREQQEQFVRYSMGSGVGTLRSKGSTQKHVAKRQRQR